MKTLILVGLAGLLIQTEAMAAVVIDPDAFAVGTDISDAFSGVTLSAVAVNARPGDTAENFGASGRVFAINPLDPFYTGDPNYPASTGVLAFGHDGFLSLNRPYGHEWTESPLSPNILLRVDFDQPTSMVAIDFIADDGSDAGVLRAFDASDNLLATYLTQRLSFAVETMTISRANADIAYVLAAGSGGSSGGLDHLRFAGAVPEPSSIALWSALAVLAALARRRR